MQQLPIYEELEFKLLQKELSLNSKDNEDQEVEALVVEGNVQSVKSVMLTKVKPNRVFTLFSQLETPK